MAGTDNLQTAVRDLVQGVRLAPLWWRLSIDQTVTRYRRTLLGPFWLASSTLATGLSLSVVFGAIFHQDIKISLPFILTGVVTWGLVGGAIVDGASTFISASGSIQVYRLPLSFHIFLQMSKLVVNFAHQLLSVWFLLAVFRVFTLPHWQLVFSLPLVLMIGFCLSLPVGMLATRYRDFSFMVGFVMQIAFMLTPVFWKRSQVPPNLQWIVVYNPLAHMTEIVRQPFLGHAAALDDWVASLMVLMVSAGVGFACLVAFRKRVVFWL